MFHVRTIDSKFELFVTVEGRNVLFYTSPTSVVANHTFSLTWNLQKSVNIKVCK